MKYSLYTFTAASLNSNGIDLSIQGNLADKADLLALRQALRCSNDYRNDPLAYQEGFTKDSSIPYEVQLNIGNVTQAKIDFLKTQSPELLADMPSYDSLLANPLDTSTWSLPCHLNKSTLSSTSSFATTQAAPLAIEQLELSNTVTHL